MDNKSKVATGVSAGGVLYLLLHLIINLALSGNELGRSRDPNFLKNAHVYFIQTDSTGKHDTMMMQDYLKQQNIIKAEKRYAAQVSDTTMMP